MEKLWIIIVREKDTTGNFPDGKGVITAVVGPFPEEVMVDRYCRIILESRLSNSCFSIHELDEPVNFACDLQDKSNDVVDALRSINTAYTKAEGAK